MRANQTVVMSHRPDFLYKLYDHYGRGAKHSVPCKLFEIRFSEGLLRESEIRSEWDILAAVRSFQAENIRKVIEFTKGSHEHDANYIAMLLRPMIETHFKACYPDEFPGGWSLGLFLAAIGNPDANRVLVPLRGAVADELDVLNRYMTPESTWWRVASTSFTWLDYPLLQTRSDAYWSCTTRLFRAACGHLAPNPSKTLTSPAAHTQSHSPPAAPGYSAQSTPPPAALPLAAQAYPQIPNDAPANPPPPPNKMPRPNDAPDCICHEPAAVLGRAGRVLTMAFGAGGIEQLLARNRIVRKLGGSNCDRIRLAAVGLVHQPRQDEGRPDSCDSNTEQCQQQLPCLGFLSLFLLLHRRPSRRLYSA